MQTNSPKGPRHRNPVINDVLRTAKEACNAVLILYLKPDSGSMGLGTGLLYYRC